MKRIGESCEEKTRPNRPLPYLFKWRDRTWTVTQVQEIWRKETKWWEADGPERRTFYRCTVHTGKASRGGNTVVELYLQERAGRSRWVVARLAD